MEADWVAERSMLRYLITLHSSWTNAQLATCLGRSESWVKKWRKRFREAAPDDQQVVFGHSRARKTPPPRTHPSVVQRILDIGDAPPENLQRVPGPRTILYYLPRHSEGIAQGVPLPRSTKTIWKILRQHDRIVVDRRRKPKPLERPEPLQEIQIDFKDDSTVPADALGKRQHVVETCNFVDAGTSIWLYAPVREDFTAETALDAVVQFLQQYGLPAMLTFDRDPRWVGSASGRDFPSALVRFLLCLGIEPNICPPHRPDKNAFVERLHRTYKEECLLLHRPSTLSQVREVTAAFMQHYNTERPHQGRSCGNVPPRVAFPTWPPLPPVPTQVDPDRWVQHIHGQAFARTVRTDGSVTVDEMRYYVGHKLAGQRINLVVHAPDQVFDLLQGATRLKRLPIKGHDAQAGALRALCDADATGSTLRGASTDAGISGSASGQPVGVSRASLLCSLPHQAMSLVSLAAALAQKAAVLPHCGHCCWVIFRSSFLSSSPGPSAFPPFERIFWNTERLPGHDVKEIGVMMTENTTHYVVDGGKARIILGVLVTPSEVMDNQLYGLDTS
jgi:transposase InsO family protein